MLKRITKLKFIVILVVVLMLIQLITAYIFGFIARSQLDLQFKQITDSPMVKVIKHDYQKKMFSLEESSEIAFNNTLLTNIVKMLPSSAKIQLDSNAIIAANDTYSIKYTTHVETGLFSGILKGKFAPTLGYAITRVEYSASLKKVFDEFFKGNPPLSIINVLYLNKHGDYYISSPSFNHEEALSGVKVIWGGLDLRIAYNPEFTQFNNHLLVPSLNLAAPTKVNLVLKNLTYTSKTHRSSNHIKVGTAALSIEELHVDLKDKVALDIKFGDILSGLTGINGVEFLNAIDAINPADFTLNRLSYTTESEDKNNYFAAKAKVRFDAIKTNNTLYGPMDVDISVNHILSAPFSRMLDKISEISTEDAISTKVDASEIEHVDGQSNNKSFNKLVPILKEYATPILVDSPEINLNKFSLKTPSGIIYVSGKVKTVGFTLKDMDSQTEFMQKILLEIHFSIPKSVLAYMFMLQMKYLLSAGNAEMDQQSTKAFTSVIDILLDNQINTWSKKGYIKNNKGILESDLLLKNGEVF